MNRIPSLLIVTNRGHLVAYRTTETRSLEKIDTGDFAEGTEKLSDLVTDQSGAFPKTGGTATSSYESLPLEAELEMRCFRQIARQIQRIIDRENPGKWGFATPSEINGAILDGIGEPYHKKLGLNLKLDLTNSPAEEVYKRFAAAAEREHELPAG